MQLSKTINFNIFVALILSSCSTRRNCLIINLINLKIVDFNYDENLKGFSIYV